MQNSNLPKVDRYVFMAEPFHCDFQKRLFMGHLGNHMLNAADFHANARGFGMDYLNSIHRTWVLSRLAIEMQQMPRAYTRFYVQTWVEKAMRFFTHRNFKVYDADNGTVYGYGRSVWAMIDTDTRQPADLLSVNDGALVSYIETDEPCPIDSHSRVKMGDGAELMATRRAMYNDIDVNGHVNSVKYIEHVLDLFPLEWYAKHPLRRLEIAYVAEGHPDDLLCYYREQTSHTEYMVRITGKKEPDGDEQELCRCRVCFNEH